MQLLEEGMGTWEEGVQSTSGHSCPGTFVSLYKVSERLSFIFLASQG